MNPTARNALILFLAAAGAAGAAGAAELITEHVDIRFNYVPETDEWTNALRYGGSYDDPEFEADSETVALPARDLPATAQGERYTQPASAAYAFTGADPGDPLWIYPQTDYGHTWPGFANVQSVGTFLSYYNTDPRAQASARWITISLTGMEYSGAAPGTPHFSLWTTSGATPTVWMATSDGISANDLYLTTENTHSHLNWGFTALGIYRITLRASAIRASDSTLVESGDHTVTFAVGTFATWRATHFSGPDIVDESIGDPFADPDADGSVNLLEYAFNTDPNTPSTTPIEPGSGTAGLPAAGLEHIAGHDYLTIEFVRRKASTNPQISYSPEFSSTLEPGSWQNGQTPAVTSLDATWERVRVTDTAPAGGRRFARVRVTLAAEIAY
jgi:surface-anchored protein